MANFTHKAGYQDLMDFDPSQGIIKYGNYEKFIYQIPEVAPQTQVVNFAGWKQSYIESLSPAVNIMGNFYRPPISPALIPSDKELRAIFDSSFKTGTIANPPNPAMGSGMSVGSTGTGSATMGITVPKTDPNAGKTGFRQVTKLGADSYQVNDYYVPTDVKLLYKMNEYATALSAVTEDRALVQEQRETQRARAANRNGVGTATLGASAGALG